MSASTQPLTETRLEVDPARAAAADIPVLKFLLAQVWGRRAAAILLTAVALSLLDLIGIALIFPYLDAVARPASSINTVMSEWLPGFSRSAQIGVLSAALVSLYIVKSAAQAILLRAQFKYMAHLTASLTNEMVSLLLRARYATFQTNAVSGLAGIAYSNTVHATTAFQALVQAANEFLFLVLLIIGFIFVQPALALSVLAVLGVLYVAVHFLIFRRTTVLGNKQRRIENQRYRLLFSMVTAIRDIKIMGLGALFDARNRAVSATYEQVSWRYNLSGALPRLLIELIVLTSLVAFVVGYFAYEMSIASIAPALGVVVVAAMRAVPTFSRLIGALNTYRFATPAVERLIAVRHDLLGAEARRRPDGLHFNSAIELRNIGFRYGSTQTLHGINMTIRRGQAIGIVGPSGSGKTTVLDLLTGLQPASDGEFICDGVRYDPFTSGSMERLIGYVPQSITLLDDSIAFNVAFEQNPDPARLHRALQIANLSQFVASLSEGVGTQVGENGLRLSGGQRQRIGIARAIYREPAILVFDEATSSLDTISERELSAEIERLPGGLTKVIVTHRLSTIADCDCIYVLSKGTVVESGTHEQLLEACPLYRRLNLDQDDREVFA